MRFYIDGDFAAGGLMLEPGAEDKSACASCGLSDGTVSPDPRRFSEGVVCATDPAQIIRRDTNGTAFTPVAEGPEDDPERDYRHLES